LVLKNLRLFVNYDLAQFKWVIWILFEIYEYYVLYFILIHG